ncbi:peptidoglycan recognition protein family protein [Clostridium facile]|uniref:N-acetylmuramoyl-L-alanine amidase n=1 Tax=Clostridium facile TaxID=2763035 RepID=A0ABR7INM2_9CLOT|nr:N-acetylmuramoyl-L-alanine amidase [Clostridium facile]MBC5786725.1 N-acetylmuramoyl-L-alanine amidase [Clostridium facile]
MLPIRKQITTKANIKCPYTMAPTRIVVHNTANDASAANEANYMCNNDLEKSTHYFVDEKEIVQCVEENRNSWNAGDGNGKGNREGISIEICYSKSGGDKFIQAEKNAVELIVDILNRYGWGIDKVTKHQDYSGKYCPHRTLDMGWNRFLNMVREKMGQAATPNQPAVPQPSPANITATYQVRTAKHGWLPAVVNLNDFAGVQGHAITDIALGVNAGSVRYRVHVQGGNWLPYVTGYNLNDANNGYAGNGKPIDAVEVYFYTPDSIRPCKKAKYRVSPVNGNYYSWQYDNETGNGQDGYAGLIGKQVDRFQLIIQ